MMPNKTLTCACTLAIAFAINVCRVNGQQPLFNSGKVLEQAEVKMEKGEYKEAIKLYKTIPRSDTNYVNSLIYLTSANDADSNYTESIRVAQSGFELFPEKANTWYAAFAKSDLELGKFQDAHDNYDKLLTRNPNDFIAHFNKGITYYRQEQYASAEKCFQRSSLINPYYSATHFYLGMTSYFQGNMVQSFLSMAANLLMDPTNKYRTNAVRTMATISVVSDDVLKYVAKRKPVADDDFEMLQEILVSKIAIDKQYKLKVALEDNIVRQLQVLLEKMTYNASDNGFWMQYYVPYFQKVFKDEQFEPMVYYILSGIDVKDIQNYTKKNKKIIEKFTSGASSYFEEIKTTQEKNFEKRQLTKIKYLHTGAAVVGRGEIIVVGEETKLSGPWEFFYENGNLKSKGQFDAKYQRTGDWVFYHENGKVKEMAHLENGELDGKSKLWFSNGQLQEESDYTKGNQNGEYRQYYYNGILKSSEQVVEGKKSGKASGYTSTGLLEFTGFYKDDKSDGETIYYHPNGKISSKYKYQNGEPDGAYLSFYLDGTREAEGSFTVGKRLGIWKHYYNDGQLKDQGNYLDGLIEGEYLEYHPNGKLMSKRNYTKGVLEGKYEEYSQAGKLYAESSFEKGKLKDLKFYNPAGELISSSNSRSGGNITFYDEYGNKVSEGPFTREGARTGKTTYFDETGKVTVEAFYKDGELHGERVAYFKNGKVQERVNYSAEEEDGYKKRYFEDGVLAYEGMIAEGQRQGLHIYYNEFGKVISKSNYLDDVLDGYVEYYSPNGKLASEELYLNGWLTRFTAFDTTGKIAGQGDLTTGKTAVTTKTNSGSPYLSSNYRNYNIDGQQKFTFPDGSPELLRNYKVGILDSTIKSYHRNGKPEYEGNYVMGEKHGKWKFYHENGTPFYEQLYSYGRLNGRYKIYNDDGTLDKEVEHKEGELHGAYKIYGDNNQLALVLIYDMGQLKAYTYEGKDGATLPEIAIVKGTAHITGYYKSGTKSMEVNYDNYELTGSRKIYFTNGKNYVESTYLAGYEHGTKKMFYLNNQVKRVENSYYGNLHGSVKGYFDNGTLEYEENYYNGKKQGDQKYYDNNGKLKTTVTYYYDIAQSVK